MFMKIMNLKKRLVVLAWNGSRFDSSDLMDFFVQSLKDRNVLISGKKACCEAEMPGMVS